MANLNKIEWLLSELESTLRKLQALAAIPRDTFLHNDPSLGAAKYFLHTAIELCLQLAQHLLESEGDLAPDQIFITLGTHHILPPTFAQRLQPMLQFHQVLLRQPWEVDDNDLYNILQNHLNEFETYIKHLRQHLNPDPAAE